METTRAGLKQSMPTMTAHIKPMKGADVVTTVASVDSSSDSEKTVSVKEEVLSSTTTMSRKQTSSSLLRIDRVTDIFRTIRRNIFQLDDYTFTEQYFEKLDLDTYRHCLQ